MNASKVIPIRRISSADVRTPTNSEVTYRYTRPDNTEWLRFSDGTEVQLGLGKERLDELNDVNLLVEYDDWYLPTVLQWIDIENNVGALLGLINNDGYRTSEEIDANNALVYIIGFGAGGSGKPISQKVLPVRQFISTTVYVIGDIGPAGGYIYNVNGTTYYECSKTGLSNGVWDTTGTLLGTTSGYDDGLSNSTLMAGTGVANVGKACLDFVSGIQDGSLLRFNKLSHKREDFILTTKEMVIEKAGSFIDLRLEEFYGQTYLITPTRAGGGIVVLPITGKVGVEVGVCILGYENWRVEVIGGSYVFADNLQKNTVYTLVAMPSTVAGNITWKVKSVHNQVSSSVLGINTFSLSSEYFGQLGSLMTYLSTYMIGPVRLLLDAGYYPVADTITINLPFPLFIEGASANTTRFYADTGLANKPMFDIQSEVWFDKFEIDGTILAGWGDDNTENVFNIATDGLYLEGKDFIIRGGYHAVNMTGASEIFFLDRVIENTQNYAINIDSAGVVGLDSEIGTISNCNGGYKFTGATGSDIIIDGVVIDGVTEYGIDYDGANFVTNRMEIKGCGYDYSGHGFTHGFDFSLQRDANIEMISNIGDADKKPMARINLGENVNTQALTSDTWTKISFTNTSSTGQKFTIADNRMTFQSDNPKNLMFWVSGNMQVTTSTSNLNVAIVKNGNTALGLFGNQSIFADVNNRNFAFSLNTMIENIVKDDYFELRCQPVGNNETVRLVDVNILCDSR